MKTINSIKKLTLIGFCSIATLAHSQLKVTSAGNIGIGILTPLTKVHIVGNSVLFAANPANPTSAALIRNRNIYSTINTPDYTWFSDDQTGLFHPTAGKMAFTCIGTEVGRFQAYNQIAFIVSGSAMASGGVFQNSDMRFKRNIVTLQSPLDKLLKLRGVSYEYNREEFQKYNFPTGTVLGMIAQELQEVVPEAVKADDEGYLAVNYTSLIPLLIESIKEQQKQIQELKQQSSASNSKSNSIGNGSPTSKDDANTLDKPVLYQNAPNPFNNVTSIKYYIPAAARTVNIYVYDITGNKKKSFEINEKGDGRIEIAANELGKGIYFYSMVIDGKIQDSKTMLITE